MSVAIDLRALRELARLYAIQTAYRDGLGQHQRASPEALMAVLRTLGAPVERLDDVPGALRERRRARWARVLEPAAVVWDRAFQRTGRTRGVAETVELRLPAAEDGRLACALRFEDGGVRRWTIAPQQLPVTRAAEVDGTHFSARRLALAEPLPSGYHTLAVVVGSVRHEMLIIAAPRRAYVPGADAAASRGAGGRGWGVFVPLYALHSGRSWGTGDFSDLETLADWLAALGGDVVATLPLLAAFLDEAQASSLFEPSPYAPVSRLFWNELFVDVDRAPELERSPAARALLAAADTRHRLDVLRRDPLVDYAGAMALKRRVLEPLAAAFFAGDSSHSEELARFREASPHLDDYACFRATCERRREPWPAWPTRLHEGRLEARDYDERVRRYHVYVQWLAHRQLGATAEHARARGISLYLDLPLGVHRYGYDVWRERARFAAGVSGGAPPDAFFTGGQDWGFPPLHPEHMRERGYGYTIATLRHHMRIADVLRLDHVMSLHRLFWVPRGLPPREGVYVRYPAHELYAILCLESHRQRTLIVGEDLGTVPQAVRRAMARHAVQRMHVVEFELAPEPEAALRPAPSASVASINTHDMPPFAAFWEDEDIERLEELGLLDPALGGRERARRQRLRAALVRFLEPTASLETSATAGPVLLACLARIAAGPARLVLVNLEDLWLERKPQNVPGTSGEYPNWRRKARYSLEELGRRPEVLRPLQELDRLRGRGRVRGQPE